MNVLDLRAVKIRFCPARILQLGQAGVVVFLYLLVFAPLLPDLVREWYEHENFTYGFLMPFIFLYLLWQDRETLQAIPRSPTPWGAVSLLAALVLALVGKAIGDLFTMRVSMVLALGGLIHLFMGTRQLKALLFPLGCLLLMVPPPYIIVKEVSYYLKMLDAFLAAGALQTFGVPVYRDSYFLHLPNISLEVADVCSGIASLFAMLALCMIYAHSLPVGWGSKGLVMMAAVFFPVVANLLRIFLVGLSVYYYGPVMLHAFFHQFTGTFTFVLSLVMLISLGELLRRKWPGRDFKRAPVGGEKTRIQDAGLHVGSWSFVLAVGMFSGVLYLSGHPSAQQRVALNSSLRDLPARLGTYGLSEAKGNEPYEDPNAEVAISRFYEQAGDKQVELFVGYRSSQNGQNRLLSPKLNLREPWNFAWVASDSIRVPDSAPIEATWMLTQRGETRRLVLYWYQARGRSFGDELSHRVDQLISVFSGGRTDGAVVRIATPVSEDERLESAKERITRFVAYVYPYLRRALPGERPRN